MVLVLPHLELGVAGMIASLLACAVMVVVLVRAAPAIRETTLRSAWWWSLATVAGLASLCVVAARATTEHIDSLEAFRFAVATLSFCPVVSVLGSKRPQHRAWNFIVLSLWGVLALPAVEMLLLQRGQGLEVNDARGWFLWLLLLLLPINYLPTRYWFASLTIACGQLLLLGEYLPLQRWQTGFDATIPISLVTIGTISAFMVSRREARPASRFDTLWLDFRDSFGLLWGLRVQERVNAFIQQQEWPLELTWHGFRNHNDDSPASELPVESERMLRQTLSGLLRRFVSPNWIASRINDDLN